MKWYHVDQCQPFSQEPILIYLSDVDEIFAAYAIYGTNIEEPDEYRLKTLEGLGEIIPTALVSFWCPFPRKPREEDRHNFLSRCLDDF